MLLLLLSVYPVPHNHPTHTNTKPHSQQISFGLHNPQDIIHCGVFNVYERALFKVEGQLGQSWRGGIRDV